MIMSGSKAPLTLVWYKEQFYTAGPMLQNGVGGFTDGKPWVSMPLIKPLTDFIMLTSVTFLVFGLSTNVPLMLLSFGYSHYMHKTCCETWLIIHVWLRNNHLLGKVEA